jgi:hypothetical protein
VVQLLSPYGVPVHEDAEGTGCGDPLALLLASSAPTLDSTTPSELSVGVPFLHLVPFPLRLLSFSPVVALGQAAACFQSPVRQKRLNGHGDVYTKPLPSPR